MSQNKTYCVIALALGWLWLATPARAISCGEGLSNSVTLTADLVCDPTIANGLEILASNVVLDLNGHTISCTSTTGYLGTCPTRAILVSGVNNVEIRGPGVITGFQVGIEFIDGTGMSLIGVTITGPPYPVSVDHPPTSNLRAGGAIGVNQTKCSFSFLAPQWTAIIEFNEISNMASGISLAGADCVLITGNYIHDNGTGIEPSYGISLSNSSNNVITTNTVTRNGTNLVDAGVYYDGGISVVHDAATPDSSAGNQILFNNVSGNCGDGISLGNASLPGGSFVHDNNIALNIVVNNSTSQLGGQCLEVTPGLFFDLADRGAGSGNVWNSNNVCKTKSASIPANVCP